jgi:hypothetical protein
MLSNDEVLAVILEADLNVVGDLIASFSTIDK